MQVKEYTLNIVGDLATEAPLMGVSPTKTPTLISEFLSTYYGDTRTFPRRRFRPTGRSIAGQFHNHQFGRRNPPFGSGPNVAPLSHSPSRGPFSVMDSAFGSVSSGHSGLDGILKDEELRKMLLEEGCWRCLMKDVGDSARKITITGSAKEPKEDLWTPHVAI